MSCKCIARCGWQMSWSGVKMCKAAWWLPPFCTSVPSEADCRDWCRASPVCWGAWCLNEIWALNSWRYKHSTLKLPCFICGFKYFKWKPDLSPNVIYPVLTCAFKSSGAINRSPASWRGTRTTNCSMSWDGGHQQPPWWILDQRLLNSLNES